jgi:hypothetical protein
MNRKIKSDQFIANTIYDLLQEQKKTNVLLQKFIIKFEGKGLIEKINKIIYNYKM